MLSLRLNCLQKGTGGAALAFRGWLVLLALANTKAVGLIAFREPWTAPLSLRPQRWRQRGVGGGHVWQSCDAKKT